MKAFLNNTIARLVLLACLSTCGVAQATAATQADTQRTAAVQQPEVTILAWQRVGSPLSMQG